jgi:peptidoglycan hydrolase-like protein with peptidoglycan-binding domain
MRKIWNVPTLVAFGALAALPACSNLMGGGRSSQASSQPAVSTSPALAPDTIKQVQARLRDDGYYKQGPVDGLWGDGTQSAVRNFQRDHSLSTTGRLDVATLEALNIVGNGNNTAATDQTTNGVNDRNNSPTYNSGNNANPTTAPNSR